MASLSYFFPFWHSPCVLICVVFSDFVAFEVFVVVSFVIDTVDVAVIVDDVAEVEAIIVVVISSLVVVVGAALVVVLSTGKFLLAEISSSEANNDAFFYYKTLTQ